MAYGDYNYDDDPYGYYEHYNQDPSDQPAPPPPPTAGSPPFGSALEFFKSLGPRAGIANWPEPVYEAIRLGLLPPSTSVVGSVIVLPSGERFQTDVGGDWGWEPAAETPGTPGTPGGEDGGGTGGDAGYDFEVHPDFLTPWMEPTPGVGPMPTFNAPGDFIAPTGESILQDPSYQFRRDQSIDAIENSAAARGVLNSGGTLKDIANYAGTAASQEYGNVWDRSFGVWNADWRNALDEFGVGRDLSDMAYNRAWQQYIERKDTHYRNQNEAFEKLFKGASLGANAARA